MLYGFKQMETFTINNLFLVENVKHLINVKCLSFAVLFCGVDVTIYHLISSDQIVSDIIFSIRR